MGAFEEGWYADKVREQAAEIERLRAALKVAAGWMQTFKPESPVTGLAEAHSLVRATLENRCVEQSQRSTEE